MAPELFFGIGALLLGLGIAWGVMQNKNRDRSKDRESDQATHDLYHQEEDGEAAKHTPPRTSLR